MTRRRDRLVLAGIGASCVGLADTVYLTIAHYADIAPACLNTGAIDCGAVTSSGYSLVPGTAIPITLPGLVWFAASGAAFLIAATGREPRWLPIAHVLLAVAGLLVVLYLVYAEIVVINRICEWCTLVHVLVLATLLITVRRIQGP